MDPGRLQRCAFRRPTWLLRGLWSGAVFGLLAASALPVSALEFSPMVLRRANTQGLVSELFLYDLTLAEVNQLRLRLAQPAVDDPLSLNYEPTLADLVPAVAAGPTDKLVTMLRPATVALPGQAQDAVLVVFLGTTLHARRYRMEAALAPGALAAPLQPMPGVATSAASALPLVNVAATSKTAAAEVNADIYAALRRWARAWEQRNVTAYFAAYEADFLGAGGVEPATSHAEWRALRRQRILSKTNIEVVLEDIQISHSAARPTAPLEVQVRFVQRYRGDSFRDVSRKRLRMVLSDSAWLISEETSQ